MYNHLSFSDLPRPHLESLVSQRGYVRIVDHKNYNPRLIECLTDSTWIGATPPGEYMALFLRTLDNPVEIWAHAFRQQLSDSARNLLFVLTTMRAESRADDLEKAFVAFHVPQCERCGVPHRNVDYVNALKELEGTFVTTRQVGDAVLVRFQNPSIRDFMQNLVLGGELLSEIIGSLVFFEQAQWFMGVLNDGETQSSRRRLSGLAYEIVDALRRLFKAPSCSFYVTGNGDRQRIRAEGLNPAARLAAIGEAAIVENRADDAGWMDANLSDLAANLEAGTIAAPSCVNSVRALEKLGRLASKEGKHLKLALKASALDRPSNLDEFEALATLTVSMADYFSERELEEVRIAYAEYADTHASNCDLGNPDEIRDEASRVGDVGDLLQVDTDSAQEALRELAAEAEKMQEDRQGENESPAGSNVLECSDAELDSMFGTLRL